MKTDRKKGGFTKESFPISRLFTHDIGKIGIKKHHIKAILELDITQAREKRVALPKTERASIFAWLVKQISLAIEKNKRVHAIRKGRRTCILFDEVDISITVEKEYQGQFVPIPLIIRKTNEKSVSEIDREIKNAKRVLVENSSDLVLGKGQNRMAISVFAALPQWIRLLIWKFLLSNPFRVKRMMGTVMVTSIGAISRSPIWFIPYSIHPLCVAFSTVTRRESWNHGEAEMREYIQLTVLIDHDVIDGIPAAQFIKDLRGLIEGG